MLEVNESTPLYLPRGDSETTGQNQQLSNPTTAQTSDPPLPPTTTSPRNAERTQGFAPRPRVSSLTLRCMGAKGQLLPQRPAQRHNLCRRPSILSFVSIAWVLPSLFE